MKRSSFSPPEAFTLHPLLALLPVKGVVGELEKLTASLYARYEKVTAVKRNLPSSKQSGLLKRINAEEAMLRQVLDWLSVSTE